MIYLFTVGFEFVSAHTTAESCAKSIGVGRSAVSNAIARNSLVLSKYYVSSERHIDKSKYAAKRNPLLNSTSVNRYEKTHTLLGMLGDEEFLFADPLPRRLQAAGY